MNHLNQHGGQCVGSTALAIMLRVQAQKQHRAHTHPTSDNHSPGSEKEPS